MKLEFTKEEKKAICGLFEYCDAALLKMNDDKTIDKVYIDGKFYDIPSEHLAHQLIMSKGAIELIREKGSINNLEKREKKFVIRNHPTWMAARCSFDLDDFYDPEFYGTCSDHKIFPYSIWCSDYCDSLGEKRYYPRKNMNSMIVDFDTFLIALRLNPNRVTMDFDKGVRVSFNKDASPLYRGFIEAARVKKENREDLIVELDSCGYPEVFHIVNGKRIRIDVSTEEGLKKLLELSPSPVELPQKEKPKVKTNKKPKKKNKRR